jgi:RelA/SpoT family (p)ppGpp synthetase
MGLFTDLRHDLIPYLDDHQIAAIEKAFLVAEKAHIGQKRHSGEDYITHPVAAARILAGIRMDHQSIMAALLHDVIEDTSLEKKVIAEQFDEQVAELVDGVSKLTQIQFENRAEAQAENFRKMLLAMVRDIRVILIKLADRLHNMRTLGVLPPEKRRRIARETLEIYAPIANRLGMHDFYTEFEDLGFAALYPMRYRILKEAVRKARRNRKEIIREIEKALKKQLESHHVNFEEINGRERHLYSIYKKMHKKRIPFAEIMDVYAFRIIVTDVDTCYRTLGLVHSLYKPVPERFRDYIAIPKVNSYQSLHTTLFGPYGVPIEIQIRTREMDHVATSGIAAHWLYKSKSHHPDKTQLRAREWLQGLMEMQESTKSPLEFIENVKIDLFPDEIYVFTPKGDILELPHRATAIDFAYAVHSDIGNSCIAAKINRRLAPLSTILSNGQTIEVITAPGARPNPAWLNFVITSKARSNIKQAVKNQRRTESIELGRELLEQALAAMSYNKEQLSTLQVTHVLRHHHYKTVNDLYESIGLGNHLPMTIARELTKDSDNAIEHSHTTQPRQPLYIKGSQGMLVSFAECCRPIPGDSIVGIFKPGYGLVVHVSTCKKIAKLCCDPEKFIDVQWENNTTGDFRVDLYIEVINQRGVLAQIANTIAAAQANIDDISVKSREGRVSVIRMTISVRDRNHLARIMRRIREVKLITKIARHK